MGVVSVIVLKFNNFIEVLQIKVWKILMNRIFHLSLVLAGYNSLQKLKPIVTEINSKGYIIRSDCHVSLN